MKKFLVGILIALSLSTGTVYAVDRNVNMGYKNIIGINGATSIAVATTSTVYSQSFEMPKDSIFGWEFKCASSGSVNVKFELEQSNFLPATEGSSDSNYVVPDSATAIATITDSTTHIVAFAPRVSQYGRLKITGISGNHASTTVSRALMITVGANK